MKRIFISAMLLLSLYALAFSQGYSVGETAPEFSLDKAGGGKLTLSDYRGQIVFLDFIGFACPFCIDDAPSVEADIWQAFKDQGVQAIGLDTWNGNEASVLGYAAGTGTTFPLAMLASTYAGLWNFSQHSFAVIDGQGIIQYIAPLSTPYPNRYKVHKQDIIDKLTELVSVAGVDHESAGVPGTFKLFQNSPNPFSDVTHIRLEVNTSQNSAATVFIYDLLGKRVANLYSGGLTSGTFNFEWNGRDDAGQLVPGGVYFYVLQNANTRIVKKLLYIRR